MTSAQEPCEWLQVCKMAECSPDFDITMGMGPEQAVYWLQARLMSRSHDIPTQEIRLAYAEVRSRG